MLSKQDLLNVEMFFFKNSDLRNEGCFCTLAWGLEP
jgi:hypothetical protein